MPFVRPSYNAILTTMVDVKKAAVEKFVEQRTKYSIEMYGAIICSNGWSHVTFRPLMNMMLVFQVWDVFFEISGHKGTKERHGLFNE